MNPVSGQGDKAALEAQMTEILTAQGISYELFFTEGEGDARRRARAADGFDAVIAAGGDGTIMEVVNGLIDGQQQVPLLQLPLGTANLLAVAFDLPRTMPEVLKLLSSGKVVEVDATFLHQHQLHSVLLTGAGWDAQVIRDASREIKNRLGFLAYVWSGVKNVFQLRRSLVTLTVDGVTERFLAHTVLFANSGEILGPAFKLGKNISPHDGKIDVIAVTPVSPLGILGLVGRLIIKDFRSDRNLMYWHGAHVRLEATPPLKVQVDGEVMGETPLELTVKPRAVRLLVPESYTPPPSLL
jgi:YegS/Rv2252/BmrU family lipid kinase